MNEGAAVFNVFRIVLNCFKIPLKVENFVSPVLPVSGYLVMWLVSLACWNKLYPPTCGLYYEKHEFTHQRTQTFLIATGLLLYSDSGEPLVWPISGKPSKPNATLIIHVSNHQSTTQHMEDLFIYAQSPTNNSITHTLQSIIYKLETP